MFPDRVFNFLLSFTVFHNVAATTWHFSNVFSFESLMYLVITISSIINNLIFSNVFLILVLKFKCLPFFASQDWNYVSNGNVFRSHTKCLPSVGNFYKHFSFICKNFKYKYNASQFFWQTQKFVTPVNVFDFHAII